MIIERQNWTFVCGRVIEYPEDTWEITLAWGFLPNSKLGEWRWRRIISLRWRWSVRLWIEKI